MTNTLEAQINALVSEGQFSDALYVVRTHGQLADKDYWEAYIAGRKSQKDSKADDEVQDFYQQALRAQPAGLEARVAWARLLLEKDLPDRALEIMDAGLKFHKHNLDYLELFVDIFNTYISNDLPLVAEDFSIFTEIFSHGYQLAKKTGKYAFAVKLSEIALHKGNADSAIAQARAALVLQSPNPWEANYMMAQAYFMKDEIDKGLTYAKRARRQSRTTDYSSICEDLVERYMHADRFAELFGALAISPGVAGDNKKLVSLKYVLGIEPDRKYKVDHGESYFIVIDMPAMGDDYLQLMYGVLKKMMQLGSTFIEVKYHNIDGEKGSRLTHDLNSKRDKLKRAGNSAAYEPQPVVRHIRIRKDFEQDNNTDDLTAIIGSYHTPIIPQVSSSGSCDTSDKPSYQFRTVEITTNIEIDGCVYGLIFSYDAERDIVALEMLDFEVEPKIGHESFHPKKPLKIIMLEEKIALLSYLFGDNLLKIENVPYNILERVKQYNPQKEDPFAETRKGINEIQVYSGNRAGDNATNK